MCCSALPTQPLQKVVAVVVHPEITKNAESSEIFATAETGWRNKGGYGYGSGWKHGGGGYRGGYLNYSGGWKRGGYYRGG